MEADTAAEPARRIPLPWLLTPIVVLSVAGFGADLAGPALINEHPLLQMALNPRNRYLLLASPQVDAAAFYLVGFVRLVLTDPLFYLLGLQYGDAALRWAERYLGDDVGMVRKLERWFSKAAPLIIVIAPSGYLCLLAGATGMRVRLFLSLNALGTIGRLVLFRVTGEAFREELFTILDFIQRYQWWLVGASLLVGLLQTRRKGARGTLASVGQMEGEIEEEIEAAESHRGDTLPGSAGDDDTTVAPQDEEGR